MEIKSVKEILELSYFSNGKCPFCKVELIPHKFDRKIYCLNSECSLKFSVENYYHESLYDVIYFSINNFLCVLDFKFKSFNLIHNKTMKISSFPLMDLVWDQLFIENKIKVLLVFK